MSRIVSMLMFVGISLLLHCATHRPLPPGTPPAEPTPSGESSPAERPMYAVESTPVTGRMVILKARLTLESQEPEAVIDSILALVSRYNGYVLRSENTRITIRVPSKKMHTVIDTIATLAHLVKKEISGEDVTDRYHDLEIRLDNAKKVRQRYLALLAKAQNVEEALRIERELERLSREIDLLEGRWNRMRHQVQYATISVIVRRETRPGPLAWVFIGTFKLIQFLFVW